MVDNAFSKEFRLLSTSDFSYLKKNSLFVKNRWLKAYFKKTQIRSKSNSRLGISASKKVGRANIRNICKRHIREYFRSSQFKLEGYDIIVIVSPFLFKSFDCKDESVKQLKSAIPHLFRQVEKKTKNN